MDVKILKQYLQKIEELVLDEDQIVTYKFLSRHLGIHVNTSKQLLHLFFKQQQSCIPCNISASFLLSGQMKDGCHYILIVGENDLERIYSKFNEITSEHIYSIQKGKITSLKKNCQMLYAIDSKLESNERCPIKFNKALSRIKPVMHEEKHGDLKVIDDKKESNSTTSSPRKEDKVRGKNAGHISNFFSKQERQKKLKETTEECLVGKKINETDSVEVKNNGKATLMSTVDEKTPEGENCKKDVKSKFKKITSEKSNKVNRLKKKRKRILSDSEESDEDEEMQDSLLSAEFETTGDGGRPNLEEETEEDKSTMRNKRKRKKIIDKTILREDGYMETLKEIVYETDSDIELSKEDGKTAATTEAAVSSRYKEESEIATNVKGRIQPGKINQKKQSTLFSYFKKN